MAGTNFDLKKTDFAASNLFHYLPVFDEIYYQGHKLANVQSFKAIREGQACTLLALSIIRKDEDFLWESTKDLLDGAIKQAAGISRGIYSFDLLTFDVHKENAGFSPHELSSVIANSCFRLKPGEQMLIRYSSVFGLLQKLVDESWGKITLKTSVEVFNDKPNFLFALVSKILKTVEFSHDPVMVLINDLSTFPLHDPANEKQKDFLDELIAQHAKLSIEFPPEVYIQDNNGVRELFSGTVVRTGYV